MEFLDMLCAEMSVIGDDRANLQTHDFHNHVSKEDNYHKVGCNCPSKILLGNSIVTVRVLKPSSIKSL